MANAKRKPAHKSTTHHKVTHRRKSTLGRLGKAAGFLALPIPDVELAIAAMANPHSGIKFVVGIAKKAGKRVSEVQSVLFDKIKWTANAAAQWLLDHGFTSAGKDEGATFWRFRQQSPGKYKEFRTIVPGAQRNPTPQFHAFNQSTGEWSSATLTTHRSESSHGIPVAIIKGRVYSPQNTGGWTVHFGPIPGKSYPRRPTVAEDTLMSAWLRGGPSRVGPMLSPEEEKGLGEFFERDLGGKQNPEMRGRYEHPAPMRDWRSPISDWKLGPYDEYSPAHTKAQSLQRQGHYIRHIEAEHGIRSVGGNEPWWIHGYSRSEDIPEGAIRIGLRNPAGEGSHYAVIDGTRIGLGTDNIIIFSTDWDYLWKLAAKGDHRLIKESGGPGTFGHTDLFYVGRDVKEYPSYGDRLAHIYPTPGSSITAYDEHLATTMDPEFQAATPDEQAAAMTVQDAVENPRKEGLPSWEKAISYHDWFHSGHTAGGSPRWSDVSEAWNSYMRGDVVAAPPEYLNTARWWFEEGFKAAKTGKVPKYLGMEQNPVPHGPSGTSQWRPERRGYFWYVSLYDGDVRVSGQNNSFIYRDEALKYANRLNRVNRHPLANPSSYDSQHPDLGQAAFDAGKDFRLSGAYSETGVANARVAGHGFSKWYYKNLPMGNARLKTKLKKNWMEGWAAGKRVEKRGNPETSASDLYREFHGKDPGETLEIITEKREHEWLVQLGVLRQLKVNTVTGLDATVDFSEKDAPEFCSNEDGTQLFVEGGDQSLPLNKLGLAGSKRQKESIVVGQVREVTYECRKGFDDFKPIQYFHHFADPKEPAGKGGELPTLIYDTVNGLLSFSGGTYSVAAPGVLG